MRFQKKRLIELARFLRTKVPAENFNMKTWLNGRPSDLKRRVCGTAACALGWACAIPRFNRLGLRFERTPRSLASAYPRYKGYDSLEAAKQFFGLRYEHVDYLFGAFNGCWTPQDAANQIDDLILQQGKKRS